jgi:FdhE protein
MQSGTQVSANEQALRELSALMQQRPELSPWLRPLGVALEALSLEEWRTLSLLPSRDLTNEPVLHHATIGVDPYAAASLVADVLSAALGRPVTLPQREALNVLRAAVCYDGASLNALPVDLAMEPAFAAAAQITAITLLQSCANALPVPTHWPHGYCPICGAHPTLAEVLGLERKRRLRCGRCGGGWTREVLLCAYCGERDHGKLGSLIPEGPAGQISWVETCGACNGYLKVRAALRGLAPEMVPIEDARTIELDMVAAERGFERPATPPFSLRIVLTSRSIA